MQIKFDATNYWDCAKEGLQKLLGNEVYKTWFASIQCIDQTADTVVLSIPNDFAAIWIQDNYKDMILKELQRVAGQSLQLVFKVSESSEHEQRPEPKAEPTQPQPISRKAQEGIIHASLLNPRNTFKNFVVGPGNQLAHAASVAVAHAPAKAYNPLFIYGETGLGKTHLIQAVAHHVLEAQPKAKVLYISSEKFMNEFIHAIQENAYVPFRQKYRKIDVLLIDDIHFLAGKESMQTEFFHTFNELFEAQKQILLTSDRPASEISRLESRLVSRFQWGLVTDIQPPDFETRQAILSSKAANMGLVLPDDILQFLAESVSRNVRRMEGALIRLSGYASLTKGTLTIDVVEHLLRDILEEQVKNQLTLERVQQKVVEYFHLKLADMVSKRRPANIALPRQIAMYLCRTLTSHSLQEIGETFGGRDHGTVIHACKAVENLMEQDVNMRRSIEYLHKELSKASSN
jgi:chromosomal replication initiator protein